MILGKMIGGFLGWSMGGFFGLLLGLVVGQWFDQGLRHTFNFGNPQHQAEVQREFLRTIFLLLGRLAKADGRVSEQEISHAEAIMQQLGITGAARSEAIAQFKRGTRPDFDLGPEVANFARVCAGHRQVTHALLGFLVSMATADGGVHAAEEEVLTQVALGLGIPAREFERILRMAQAQGHFHGGAGQGPPSRDHLADAYQALGVDPGCSDRELKRAYRRLMSENHPDKLIAKGVPEEMIKLATERSQEIQAAYELAKKHRG